MEGNQRMSNHRFKVAGSWLPGRREGLGWNIGVGWEVGGRRVMHDLRIGVLEIVGVRV